MDEGRKWVVPTVRKDAACPAFVVVCWRLARQLPSALAVNINSLWNFVSQHTPKSFHNNTYRKKRAHDLLSRERSLLPMTQRLIVDRDERERRLKELLELDEEAHYLKSRLKHIQLCVVALQSRTYDGKIKKEKSAFIMGCGVPECRGFLSQAWKCGTCAVHTCSKCRVVKVDGEEHECKPDDVATAKLLAKETKPCPKCTATIYKDFRVLRNRYTHSSLERKN